MRARKALQAAVSALVVLLVAGISFAGGQVSSYLNSNPDRPLAAFGTKFLARRGGSSEIRSALCRHHR